MPLRVTRRRDTGALTITGTVAGQRIRRRAASDSLALAREEAAAIETEILRTQWHGERRGARALDEALVSYLDAAPRSEHTQDALRRIRLALGNVPLGAIDQDTTARLARLILGRQRVIARKDGTERVIAARPPALATVLREIITPLRALLRYAARRGWCDPPQFEAPASAPGRTRYLLPAEAEQLVDAAAAHLRPLLIFLLCTGARLSEALGLEWRDVDLQGARATFWGEQTKSRRRRVVFLPARAVVSLAGVPGRDGRVFRSPGGAPYETGRERGYGGQIKSGWRGAIRRAGLAPELTPHDCRHTWASWHYALHRDLIRLREDGGWSSVLLVERYAHLMKAGQEDAIRAFWRVIVEGKRNERHSE